MGDGMGQLQNEKQTASSLDTLIMMMMMMTTKKMKANAIYALCAHRLYAWCAAVTRLYVT